MVHEGGVLYTLRTCGEHSAHGGPIVEQALEGAASKTRRLQVVVRHLRVPLGVGGGRRCRHRRLAARHLTRPVCNKKKLMKQSQVDPKSGSLGFQIMVRPLRGPCCRLLVWSTVRVADPDPYWIRIQSGQRIRIRIRNPDRIQEGKNDPQILKSKKFHVFKCWMFSFEG